MTLHETVHERNEMLNPTSFFVFFFCCKEEKHETHKCAFWPVEENVVVVVVVVVLIISSKNEFAFLSRSLSLSQIFFSVCSLCPKKERKHLPKKQTIWTLSRDDGSSSACVLFVRDDSFPAKRAEERENSKNLKKNDYSLDTKRKKRRDIPHQNLSLQTTVIHARA